MLARITSLSSIACSIIYSEIHGFVPGRYCPGKCRLSCTRQSPECDQHLSFLLISLVFALTALKLRCYNLPVVRIRLRGLRNAIGCLGPGSSKERQREFFRRSIVTRRGPPSACAVTQSISGLGPSLDSSIDRRTECVRYQASPLDVSTNPSSLGNKLDRRAMKSVRGGARQLARFFACPRLSSVDFSLSSSERSIATSVAFPVHGESNCCSTTSERIAA